MPYIYCDLFILYISFFINLRLIFFYCPPQDPLASSLDVRPTSEAECDALARLATLYSLRLRVEDNYPADSCRLTK